jgi:hypothetical protein
MQLLAALKKTAKSGVEMCKWLSTDVQPVVDETTRKIVKEVEDHIRDQYPARIIPGLGNRAEYCFSMLYLVQPPEWLNDAFINATCQRLCDQFPRVRHAGTPDAKPGSACTNHQKVPQSIQEQATAVVDRADVDVLLVPVNFGNSHWGGILVDVPTRQVLYYDSLNQTHYVTTLKKLAMSIKDGLQGYTVQQAMVPIQFDGFSCGIFVCFFFFNHVTAENRQLGKHQLALRRWELLYYVLLGHGPLRADES